MSETTGGARVFAGRDLRSTSAMLRQLRRGGLVVLDGPWPEVHDVYRQLTARQGELVCRAPGIHATGRQWEKARSEVLRQVLTRDPGEGDIASLGQPGGALMPVADAARAREARERPIPLEALDGRTLVVLSPVLAPVSRETQRLLRQALETCRADLPPAPAVLDMGCGSGLCTILAALLLGPAARVLATDILPEALAATRLNADRLGFGNIAVTGGGDLFVPVGDAQFDLIVFNVPWVIARVRSPAEIATNDPGQRTLARFLAAVRDHLRPGGRLLLGYADNSGAKALARLGELAAAAGLEVRRVHRDRIRTRRKHRAWETVFVYEMAWPSAARPAETGGLGHVGLRDLRAAGEVGDGPGEADDAVAGPQAEPQTEDGLPRERAGRR